jgi:Zn-finger protein
MCNYYPCHKELESCLFCYCPIYPCFINKTKGKLLDGKNWDCSECTIIHNKKLVEKIQKYIKKEVEKCA